MMKTVQKQTNNDSNRLSTSATEGSWQDQSAQSVNNRKEAVAQRAKIAGINNSPRMLAQRRRVESYLGINPAQATEPAPIAALPQQPVQRLKKPDDEKTLQPKFASEAPAKLEQQPAPKTNHTGLPDNLKNGIEALSGLSMDNVNVHYNSSQPVQLNALAYAQGTDIHVGPGQEKHLPHEAWHVVQQKQGRVKPTLQMKDKAGINDNAGLETEADQMGQKALNLSSSHFTKTETIKTGFGEISQPVIQALKVPDYPGEDFLIARLRGIDHLLTIRDGAKSDVIIEELDKLSDQIRDKIWLRAVAVIIALEDKWHIDEIPPPLIPQDAPPLVNGIALLREGGIIPLHERPQAPVEVGPGTRMIELGAGNMSSASSSWMKNTLTAFTEYRSKQKLIEDYDTKFTDNLEMINSMDPENKQQNTLAYGIDATQEGAFHDLPLTERLRFTNPNIGHQDIADAIDPMIKEAIDEDEEGNYRVYSSMGLSFMMDMDRAIRYRDSTKKDTWLTTIITSTANSISICRNVNMLFSFMQNAPAKLIPGSGVVEIIVSESYLQRWPLEKMARDMNYGFKVEKYELGFENIKTQESENVSSQKPPQKVLITLTPPWGGGIKIKDVLDYCNTQTIYTRSQPTLLSRVWKT